MRRIVVANVSAVVVGALLVAGVTPAAALCGQDAVPSPAAPSHARTGTGADQSAGSTTQPETTGFLQQEELTGDWGGRRSRWKDKGIVVDGSLSQFYQGVTSGGTETGSEYNGTALAGLDLDFWKLAGWEYWSAAFQIDMRFGGPVLGGTGSINPVNTAALIPAPDGTELSVTAVNLTRLFPVDLKVGRCVALSFGRYNVVDLLHEDFFAGAGVERYFNIAQIGPLTVLRQVPLVTNAISLAYIRNGVPYLSFSVMDPNDHSLDSGLSDLFEDGVTLYPSVNVPTTYFGKTGKHTFGGAITTKPFTPFDAIRQILLPGPPLDPIEPQSGSWSIMYVFRQYIVERATGDGWGLFSQFSFADRATSPVTTFLDVGLGGNGIFSMRPRDEFGFAYAYTDLSQDLKDNLDLLTAGGQPVRAEHQFETFYNVHIAPWLQLTGDLQSIRPTLTAAGTAIVPGVRLRIVF